MQQPLTGSSAILVHRTALCLLSLGRGYSRLQGVAQFAAMWKFAMSFGAILFGADPARSDARLTVANASGPHHIRSFAQETQGLEAVLVR
jgi:hypothetical protein